MKIKKDKILFHAGQILLYTFALDILIAAIGFAIGITINILTLPVSFFLALALTLLFYDAHIKPKTIIIELFIAVAVIATTIVIANGIYDFSWDGNAYHKLAVGLLKNGWNPLSKSADDAIKSLLGVESGNIWVEGYCKATWIFASSVYAITGNIESGKIYTLYAMICIFFLLESYFTTKKGHRMTGIIFAIAVACNPVAMAQLDTFYVDGFLHTMLFVLVFALFTSTDPEHVISRKTSASLVASAMVIIGNIKFTGLFYGGIFCITFFIWQCVRNIKDNKELARKKNGKLFVLYMLLAVVTVVLAGNSSYITNILRHGNPLYPLAGKNSIDIMTNNSPFAEVNHFRNLFISLFSMMDNFLYNQGKAAFLKFPFTVYSSEKDILAFNPSDIRLSGFGVLFSGLLIVAIVFLVIWFFKGKKDSGFYLVLLNLGVCIALTFGLTESWWARYSPYIYLIVLLALYIAIDSDKAIFRIAGNLLGVLLIINSLLFLVHLSSGWEASKIIKTNIANMNSIGKVNVCTTFSGIYFNLNDYDIDFEINMEIAADPNAVSIGYYDLKCKAMEIQ